MRKQKIETSVIIRTFNQCGSFEKTAEILGYTVRTIRDRVKRDCRVVLVPKNGDFVEDGSEG